MFWPTALSSAAVRWIIGDIHGMRNMLVALIDAIGRTDADPTFLFAGDYVNRGPESRGVIEYLLQLPNARFCRGNHDDILDVVLNGRSFVEQLTHNDRHAAYKWFMAHGLAQTLESYGATPAALQAELTHPSRQGFNALIAGVPLEHRNFIRNLLPVIEEPDLFVLHARWNPAVPDEDPGIAAYLEADEKLRQSSTWERFTIAEIDAPKQWRRRGFFGHTPVDAYGARGGFDIHGGGHLKPVVGDKVVLLDTAAALSPVGRLTGWCAETNNIIQIDRKAQVVP